MPLPARLSTAHVVEITATYRAVTTIVLCENAEKRGFIFVFQRIALTRLPMLGNRTGEARGDCADKRAQ